MDVWSLLAGNTALLSGMGLVLIAVFATLWLTARSDDR
jgi:hypothetical protein